jgi:hypothetical protein
MVDTWPDAKGVFPLIQLLEITILIYSTFHFMAWDFVWFIFVARLSRNAKQPNLCMPISYFMCLIMFVSIRNVTCLSLSYENDEAKNDRVYFRFYWTEQKNEAKGYGSWWFIMRQYLILDPNYWRNMLYKAIPLLV